MTFLICPQKPPLCHETSFFSSATKPVVTKRVFFCHEESCHETSFFYLPRNEFFQPPRNKFPLNEFFQPSRKELPRKEFFQPPQNELFFSDLKQVLTKRCFFFLLRNELLRNEFFYKLRNELPRNEFFNPPRNEFWFPPTRRVATKRFKTREPKTLCYWVFIPNFTLRLVSKMSTVSFFEVIFGHW